MTWNELIEWVLACSCAIIAVRAVLDYVVGCRHKETSEDQVAWTFAADSEHAHERSGVMWVWRCKGCGEEKAGWDYQGYCLPMKVRYVKAAISAKRGGKDGKDERAGA